MESPLEKFRNLEIFDENLEIFKPPGKFFRNLEILKAPLENLDLDGLNCVDTCKFLDIIEIFIGREAKFHKINTEKFFRINPNEIRFRPY